MDVNRATAVKQAGKLQHATAPAWQFGPDVPQAQAGQSSGRSTDRDATGGGYHLLWLFVPVPEGGIERGLRAARFHAAA